MHESTLPTFPDIITDCEICDNGCNCEPGTAGCEHWGCWGARSETEATCPSAGPHRASFYVRHPSFRPSI